MTLSSISARDGQTGVGLQQQVYLNPDGSVLPIQSSVQKKWRTDFSGSALNPAKWEITQTGSGMSYTVANGALSITTGTTLDDELIITSKETFTVPMRAMTAVNLSQRIAGQTCSIEFVSVDPDSEQPDGWSAMAWRLDGISATQGIYEVSTATMPRLMSVASTIPTTANTTWSVLELEAFADENWFHGRVLDSTAARANSYVRHQQICDPDKLYKLRIRITNRQMMDSITAIAAHTDTSIKVTRASHGLTTGDSITISNVAGLTGVTFPLTTTVTVLDTSNFTLAGTAGFSGTWINQGWAQFTKNAGPASSTTVGVNYVTILDYTELTAEITAGRGNNAAGQGLSVNVNTLPTAIVTGQAADNSTTVPSSVMIGVKAATAALATAATGGRNQSLMGTAYGVGLFKPFSIPELDWQYAAASGGITNTTDVVAKTAGAAGIRNYVTGATLINSSAVATEFVIKDGATVIWRTMLPASMNQPQDCTFVTPLRGSAAAAINLACITTGAAVYANVQGFQAP